MVDFAEILDGNEPAIPPVEPPAEPPMPKEPETAPDAPPEAPPPAPEPAPQHEQDRMVPLTAMLDTRDKLKAAERRLAELEAAQRPQASTPDPYDDPDGFEAHINARLQKAEIDTRLNTSNLIARQAHGNDVVQAALNWAAEKASSDPTFEQRMIADQHPVDWVVRQHKRDGLLSEVGDDPDAYVRRRAAELGLIAPDAGAAVVAVPGQQQAQKPAAPPRSIASAAGAGSNREVATGPLSAFGANFKA